MQKKDSRRKTERISRKDNVEIMEAEKDGMGVEKDENRKQADFGKLEFQGPMGPLKF